MSEQPASEPQHDSSTKRWLIRAVIAVAAVVIIGYGAIFFYAEVINDSPDELDTADLSDALDASTDSTVAEGEAAGSNDEAASASTEQTTTAPAEAASAGYEGDWVPTSSSEFGYRVDEVIAGVNITAVGRSNEIAGVLTIEGTEATTVDIEVQVASIESDDSRRDGQFTGRIMSASEFPTATFSLSEPIDFGVIAEDGTQVTVGATGDLTLRGTTNEVTFELTAEASGDQIGVLGNIPVVFADYGIPNPSIGPVTTEDNGLLEFVLVFERA